MPKAKRRQRTTAQLLAAGMDSLACLDGLRGRYSHAGDAGFDPNESYEFNIRWPLLNIPDEVRAWPSGESVIESVMDSYTETGLPSFMDEWQHRRPEIGKWAQAGRSGGWLVVEDAKYSYDTLKQAMREADSPSADRAARSDLVAAIRQADMACRAFAALGKAVRNTIRSEAKRMSTVKFWRQEFADRGFDVP